MLLKIMCFLKIGDSYKDWRVWPHKTHGKQQFWSPKWWQLQGLESLTFQNLGKTNIFESEVVTVTGIGKSDNPKPMENQDFGVWSNDSYKDWKVWPSKTAGKPVFWSPKWWQLQGLESLTFQNLKKTNVLDSEVATGGAQNEPKMGLTPPEAQKCNSTKGTCV